jgi:zinc transporter 11
VAVGFLLGAAFVSGTDMVLAHLGVTSPTDIIIVEEDKSCGRLTPDSTGVTLEEDYSDVRRRRKRRSTRSSTEDNEDGYSVEEMEHRSRITVKEQQWRRILLLIVAVTVHNIPEGLAVGVGFGAVGRTKSATFESARNLAIGIAIQNFPEGIAVSVPLKAAGFSTARSIWYGQLSGMVEPVAGVLGAALVTFIVPILPYALAFAAGAMVYVVMDDLIPEAQAQGNGKAASWGSVVGFIVMMCLDIALG